MDKTVIFMDEVLHDSYCGLYCGACEILNLFKVSEEMGRTAEWDELPGPLRYNIREADIICRGCRSDTVFAGCRGCQVRECARDKGVKACVTCPDFPCEHVEALRSLLPGIQGKLPHTSAILCDYETAKAKGYEAWAEAQRTRWQCPSCGAPFTWYQERCGVCRMELKGFRGY